MFWRRKKARRSGRSEGNGHRDDIAIARAAFEQGDHRHAISHVAWALAADPVDAEARALLDQILGATREPLHLVPFEEPQTPYTIAAVRAYILAGQGQLDEAISLMSDIYEAVPGTPFFPWLVEWLSNPERADTVRPETMRGLLAQLHSRFSDYNADEEHARLEQILPMLRRYHEAHPRAAHVASMTAALVRKSGRIDEALAMARAAYETAPDYSTAAVLATTYRLMGDLPRALEIFRGALQYDPDDIAIRLDIGDLLLDTGQIEAALAAYQEALAREPEHPWAYPASLYCRHLLDPGGPWHEQLVEYARSHEDSAHAQDLAGRYPYVTSLPEPADATVNGLRHLAAQPQEEVTELKIGLSSLESPSARLALEQYQIERYGRANVMIEVAEIQQPDPRLPRGHVDYLLWRYDGTDPRPAVEPPSPEVADAVAGLALYRFDSGVWASQARQIAAQLGQQSLAGLLGTMVHPPKRREPYTIWVWIHNVQVAAAFVIAYLDKGWEGSLRKRALFSLARGPMDWTVEAAIIALWQIAREEPDTVPDIAELYLELLSDLPRPGYVPYLDALLACSLRLPSAPQKLRDLAQRMWRDEDE